MSKALDSAIVRAVKGGAQTAAEIAHAVHGKVTAVGKRAAELAREGKLVAVNVRRPKAAKKKPAKKRAAAKKRATVKRPKAAKTKPAKKRAATKKRAAPKKRGGKRKAK